MTEKKMNLANKQILIRWANGTFSFCCGTGNQPIYEIIDAIGDPGGAEARIVPTHLIGTLYFNQNLPGEKFDVHPDAQTLWNECEKQVWPDGKTLKAHFVEKFLPAT